MLLIFTSTNRGINKSRQICNLKIKHRSRRRRKTWNSIPISQLQRQRHFHSDRSPFGSCFNILCIRIISSLYFFLAIHISMHFRLFVSCGKWNHNFDSFGKFANGYSKFFIFLNSVSVSGLVPAIFYTMEEICFLFNAMLH